MSVVPTLPASPLTRSFGSGGAEPWASALSGESSGLYLVGDDLGVPLASIDFDRFIGDPDATDLAVLDGLAGPVLDIGCGPGRMVRAALDAGLAALGIDIAAAAVDRCAAEGLPVLHRSVFDRLPKHGRWGAALLLDGNVGIGGDVPALLARCRALLRPGGLLVVEVHTDRHHDLAYLGTLVDVDGAASDSFPWAEVGEDSLVAAAVGFALDAAWESDARRFCRLRRIP